MSKIKSLTDSNFHSTVDNLDVVLIKFGADWCGPCKALAPILEQVANEVSYPVFEVDVDDAMDIAAEYKIRGVPTLLVLKKGQLHARHSGLTTKENILKLAE